MSSPNSGKKDEQLDHHREQFFSNKSSSPKDLLEEDSIDIASDKDPYFDQSQSKHQYRSHTHTTSMMDNLLWNMPKRVYDWWSGSGEETIGIGAENDQVQEFEEEEYSHSHDEQQARVPVFMELTTQGIEYDGQDMLASEHLLVRLHDHLPQRWRAWEKRWKLVYSTARDGVSLNTLYNNVGRQLLQKKSSDESPFSYSSIGRHSFIHSGNDRRSSLTSDLLHHTRTRAISTTSSPAYSSISSHNTPCLLIIKAHQNPNLLMGVMSMDPFQPTCSTYTRQYGNAECFLFTYNHVNTSSPLTVYVATGKNQGFLIGTKDWLAAGVSEGRFGLWVDGKLQRGCTSACATYDNPELLNLNTGNASDAAKTVEFGIYGVEVWSLIL